jgi:hypothetical protein
MDTYRSCMVVRGVYMSWWRRLWLSQTQEEHIFNVQFPRSDRLYLLVPFHDGNDGEQRQLYLSNAESVRICVLDIHLGQRFYQQKYLIGCFTGEKLPSATDWLQVVPKTSNVGYEAFLRWLRIDKDVESNIDLKLDIRHMPDV